MSSYMKLGVLLAYVHTYRCEKNNPRTDRMCRPICLCAYTCVSVCLCVCVSMSQSVRPWCTQGFRNPEAGRVSWKLSCPRRPALCWGIVQACNPSSSGADIWRLSVWQRGRTIPYESVLISNSVLSVPLKTFDSVLLIWFSFFLFFYAGSLR